MVSKSSSMSSSPSSKMVCMALFGARTWPRASWMVALAETKYHNSLDLKLCVARVVKNGKPYDLEVVSEATDDHMALRAVRNQIFEEYGLDTNIKHIFVDGRKYGTNQIKEWRARV